MSDRYECKRCGRSLNFCICKVPREPQSRALLAVYIELRSTCVELEKHIGEMPEGDDAKRLDKSVTVMKLAFKELKKVLRGQGLMGADTRAWRDVSASVQAGEGADHG